MTLSYDALGGGPAVFLLHSTVGDCRMWNPQVPAFVDAGYRTVRADLRGYGDTPVPDGPCDDARDVIGLLDELGIGQTALVAASGGGRVALEVAARWPSRVTALALLCTALRGHEPGPELAAFSDREDALLEAGDVAGATELNVAAFVGPHADDRTRDLVRQMQRHAFDVQLAAVEEFAPVRAGHDLAAITARSLLVSGAHDLPDFRAIAVQLAGLLPQARHVELDWAGHLPNLERPDEVNALLLDFLGAPSAPSAAAVAAVAGAGQSTRS
ncbi:alpha/beta fold hydrolase [Micromonosporaceae bacterium Da 78-11]